MISNLHFPKCQEECPGWQKLGPQLGSLKRDDNYDHLEEILQNNNYNMGAGDGAQEFNNPPSLSTGGGSELRNEQKTAWDNPELSPDATQESLDVTELLDEQNTTEGNLESSPDTTHESLDGTALPNKQKTAGDNSEPSLDTTRESLDGTELLDEQNTTEGNSESSPDTTHPSLDGTKLPDEQKTDEYNPESSDLYETVEVPKGTQKHFLKCNASFELPNDSKYEAISFDSNFLSDTQIKLKISNEMEKLRLFPCGPWIHLNNLRSGNESIHDTDFKGILSIRHYLYLQSQDKLLPKQGGEMCPSNDDDKYFIVSFNENTGKLSKHECTELKAHYATTNINSFSYWCFAAEKCQTEEPCSHRFNFNLYFMCPKSSDCPHGKTSLYVLASGDDWKERDKTIERHINWSNVEHIKRAFYKKMTKDFNEEHCAEEIQIMIQGCSNKFDILLRHPQESKTESQWYKLETDFSMEKFVYNHRLGVYAIHFEGAFPFGGCEKENVTNCSRIKFQSKSVPLVKGYPEELYEDNGLNITIFDCKLKNDDRRRIKLELYDNNKEIINDLHTRDEGFHDEFIKPDLEIFARDDNITNLDIECLPAVDDILNSHCLISSSEGNPMGTGFIASYRKEGKERVCLFTAGQCFTKFEKGYESCQLTFNNPLGFNTKEQYGHNRKIPNKQIIEMVFPLQNIVEHDIRICENTKLKKELVIHEKIGGEDYAAILLNGKKVRNLNLHSLEICQEKFQDEKDMMFVIFGHREAKKLPDPKYKLRMSLGMSFNDMEAKKMIEKKPESDENDFNKQLEDSFNKHIKIFYNNSTMSDFPGSPVLAPVVDDGDGETKKYKVVGIHNGGHGSAPSVLNYANRINSEKSNIVDKIEEKIKEYESNGTELPEEQKTDEDNSESSPDTTQESLDLDVTCNNDDKPQVYNRSQHIPFEFQDFYETVEVQKGKQTHFLKCNASFKLPDDSKYEAITFDSKFLSKTQTKEKISNGMERLRWFPCGPWIHLENLKIQISRVFKGFHREFNDTDFKGFLSIRHYLYLQSQDKLLPKQGGEMCPSNDDDKYFIVSFNENTGKLSKHECTELKAHYATTEINSFSYWCFASEKCQTEETCRHSFKLDLYFLCPKSSDCPHGHTSLYLLASGDDWKETDETIEHRVSWSKVDNLKGMFYTKMTKEFDKEHCAEEMRISIIGCSDEYDILLRPPMASENESQWDKLQRAFSMEKFVFNQSLGVYRIYIKGAFPAGGCEKVNIANSSMIKFQSKSVPEVKGYPEELYEDSGLNITIFDCKRKDDRRRIKLELYETNQNPSPNITKPDMHFHAPVQFITQEGAESVIQQGNNNQMDQTKITINEVINNIRTRDERFHDEFIKPDIEKFSRDDNITNLDIECLLAVDDILNSHCLISSSEGNPIGTGFIASYSKEGEERVCLFTAGHCFTKFEKEYKSCQLTFNNPLGFTTKGQYKHNRKKHNRRKHNRKNTNQPTGEKSIALHDIVEHDIRIYENTKRNLVIHESIGGEDYAAFLLNDKRVSNLGLRSLEICQEKFQNEKDMIFVIFGYPEAKKLPDQKYKLRMSLGKPFNDMEAKKMIEKIPESDENDFNKQLEDAFNKHIKIFYNNSTMQGFSGSPVLAPVDDDDDDTKKYKVVGIHNGGHGTPPSALNYANRINSEMSNIVDKIEEKIKE